MNQTNLLQKLAPLGVAAFGALSIIGISPAQAAVIGSLGYDNGTDNFFDEVEPGAGDTFDVIFSPDNIIQTSFATGIFTPTFTAAPPPVQTTLSAPAIGEFEFIQFVPGSVTEFEYELTDDLVFNYSNGTTITIAEDAVFQGEFDEGPGGVIEGVEFEIITAENVTVELDGETYNFFTEIMDPPGPGRVTGETFTFSQSVGAPGGTYEGSVVISQEGVSTPEPTTILGLLTIGGLGLGLKRKKQS